MDNFFDLTLNFFFVQGEDIADFFLSSCDISNKMSQGFVVSVGCSSVRSSALPTGGFPQSLRSAAKCARQV